MGTMFRRPVEVLRAASGAYVDGTWVEQPPTSEILYATVQPLALTDLDKIAPLLEGRRADRAVRVYTDVPLAVADQTSSGLSGGDRVVWPAAGQVGGVEPRTYRVIARADWQAGMGTDHFKHYAYDESDR